MDRTTKTKAAATTLSNFNTGCPLMQYRTLGRTGIQVSALAFGAGPISTLMVGDHSDRQQGNRQRAVVEHAIAAGVNWFDTAATYGAGQSERSLGRALVELGASERVHVATKVRLIGDDLADIRGAVRRSVEGSLERLRLSRVTLLQLHNSITPERGDEPTSIAPADVLGPGGVAEVFEALLQEGLVAHLGLTGLGDPASMTEVVRSGRFDTMQTPYHLLNPSAGRAMEPGFAETDYGNIIDECARQQMGVLAIRVLAGGALADNPPSPHTFKTPFFPLPLYERDRRSAARLQAMLGRERPLTAEALRFALAHPQIQSAIVGFGEEWQIDAAARALADNTPPLEWDDIQAAIQPSDSERTPCESSSPS